MFSVDAFPPTFLTPLSEFPLEHSQYNTLKYAFDQISMINSEIVGATLCFPLWLVLGHSNRSKASGKCFISHIPQIIITSWSTKWRQIKQYTS